MPLVTIFLLIFIPLYPKLPLVDVRHTWVYIRIEDFIVLFSLAGWLFLLLRKKVSLQTPLTVPILVFWIAGALSTIHGVVLLFPDMANVFPGLALLSYLRRIEYLSLFFIAYSGSRDKRFLPYLIVALTLTVLAVVGYGIGQKYFGFYAYLTMNEEFAKGIPIQLSHLSRISSTFGGHYDLAAYLVLVIPIIVSLVFAFKKRFLQAAFLMTALLGTYVLFMTVSRISFFALFVSVGFVLVAQKSKLIIFSLPVLAAIILSVILFSPSLLSRFGSTIKEIDVLVDAKTGLPIGQLKEVPRTYLANKLIKQNFAHSIASPDNGASSSAGLVVPYTTLPEKVEMLETSAPTGEDLPQGTGYINLLLSPVTKRLGNFFFERKSKPDINSADVFVINGDYLLKKALAYDLSFTTRFQGEWPHALAAFKKDVFFGSGYGSVGLAVDNSYLRMLGETGIFGFSSFLAIFIIIGIYLKNVLPAVTGLPERSFVIGLIGGIVGLAINAVFIDVFEASKVAFTLWLLIGVALGTLGQYQNGPLEIYKRLRSVAISTYAIVGYLFIASFVLYSPMVNNFFVGDDFTWFRWAADCHKGSFSSQHCTVNLPTIIHYFTQSDGFFYRPGAKIYYLVMYSVFWLNQTVYHMVSLFLHFAVAVLVFLLAKKVLKNLFLAGSAGFIFLILNGYSEAVLWISATGFLFTTFFSLLSLLSYIAWEEKKKIRFFVATMGFFTFSLLFHELGVVTPLLFLLYSYAERADFNIKSFVSDVRYKFLLAPLGVYLVLRYMAHSHWLSGDYSYNILRLPFNAVGNSIGYFLLTLVGQSSIPFYQILRNSLREHKIVAVGVTLVVCLVGSQIYKIFIQKIKNNDRKIFYFGIFFFMIALLPFLGLGNIASRYSYLSSIGVVFLFVVALKKLYAGLISSGKDIATSIVVLIVSIFCLFQIIQLQQAQGDWREAGEISKKFFISLDSIYGDDWSKQRVELHFVDVPIRSGEAWVYPVGIEDAVWFVFRNPNIKVYKWATLSQAYQAVQYDSKTQKVLEFNKSGIITERKKPINFQ